MNWRYDYKYDLYTTLENVAPDNPVNCSSLIWILMSKHTWVCAKKSTWWRPVVDAIRIPVYGEMVDTTAYPDEFVETSFHRSFSMVEFLGEENWFHVSRIFKRHSDYHENAGLVSSSLISCHCLLAVNRRLFVIQALRSSQIGRLLLLRKG